MTDDTRGLSEAPEGPSEAPEATAAIEAPESDPEPQAGIVALRYIGGGAYVIGVPTTDLAVSPAEARRLTATGLYRRDRPGKARRSTEE